MMLFCGTFIEIVEIVNLVAEENLFKHWWRI